MAATDVLLSSPMTPGQAVPWSSFEDYIDLPSPLATPRLSNASVSAPSFAVAQQQPALKQAAQDNAPPPGSSPETLFRYYLAAELRRMGASADETIIDKYVAQHYNSFNRTDRQSTASTSAAAAPASANGTIASPADLTMSLPDQQQQQQQQQMQHTSPFKVDEASVRGSISPGGDINPHLVELSSVHQPFTVSRLNPADQVESSPNSKSSASYRSNSAEADGMSEDDEEDNGEGEDEDVKPNNKSGKFTAFRPSRIDKPAHEEAHIPGSIMGPSNELRPDPEEYRKLSSKEKRQLRNKISARNFRTRRKEHISHLEQQVADRDAIIEGLRQQLAQVTVQNKELNEEVRSLKSKSMSSTDVNKILEALQKGLLTNNSNANATSSQEAPMGPPGSATRPPSSASMNETGQRSSRPSTPNGVPLSPRPMSPRPSMVRRQSPAIGLPNTKKDLPPSAGTSNGSRSFWGGVGGSGSSNSFMSVHTVLVPHLPTSSLTFGEKSHFNASRPSDDATQLARLLSEKLSVADSSSLSSGSPNEKTSGKSSKALTDAQVNEAFVSLMGVEDDVAPPSYSEATNVAAPAEEQAVQVAVLDALRKVFASSTADETVDENKLQALLAGRASLRLIDNATGKAI